MKSMLGTVLVVAWPMFAGAQTAPAAESLPEKLSGRWTATGPAGVFNDTIELRFDGDRSKGEVSGHASFRGVVCGSKDEPFRGTWDGTELRIEAMHRASVNTQRMAPNAQCGRTVYTLRRKAGESAFEGEGRMEGSNAVAVMRLSP